MIAKTHHDLIQTKVIEGDTPRDIAVLIKRLLGREYGPYPYDHLVADEILNMDVLQAHDGKFYAILVVKCHES